MKNRNRKILLLAVMFLTAVSLSAQHYIGVYGGYGGGAYRPDPQAETGAMFGYPRFAASWKYYSPQAVVGGVGADLMYVKKGFKVWPRVDSDTTYRRTVESIELPIMWQPHLYMFNRKARIFVNLGVYVSYNIASDTSTVSSQHGTLHEGKYPLRKVKDNKFGYGLTGGAGFGVFVDRFEIFAEVRYSYGYSDLLKYPRKYPGSPQRSPVDHFGMSLGVYYRLGKGGILAPPVSKKKRRQLEEEQLQLTE